MEWNEDTSVLTVHMIKEVRAGMEWNEDTSVLTIHMIKKVRAGMEWNEDTSVLTVFLQLLENATEEHSEYIKGIVPAWK